MKTISKAVKLALAGGVALNLVYGAVLADDGGSASQIKNCKDAGLTYEALKGAIANAPEATSTLDNGGFGLHMWVTLVNRDGFVCAVAFTGINRGAEWPASRVISAQKASTANSLSTPAGVNLNFPNGLALSTANLYTSALGGGSLFGVQFSNPVDTQVAYKGPAVLWGQANDPMVGNRAGGHNVFGGGLALYNKNGKLVGALGASGDTSCKDHNYAWQIRHALNLDYLKTPVVVTGVAAAFDGDTAHPDNIIYDMAYDATDKGAKNDLSSTTGFGHVMCGFKEDSISPYLPAVQ
ncbi:heme-binding protein [Methyloglobulus sp.]|uniref:heme-binding protein n=1 Tax=Methyloglobulus sp. TaxID=2518622 RepID=UPI003989EA92